MITVILNCYKRPQYLEKQIQSIKDQTVKCDDIWVWYNKPENETQYDLSHLEVKTATINHNFKFHGRFSFGLLAQTEYLAFFDDDTIPGVRWFENCLNTIHNGYDGILGTSGVRLDTLDRYTPNQKVGWNGLKSNQVEKVHLVGHAWFFRKDYLRYMWYEEPISWDNGEDIQLSYLSQKYGNINTYVPPHPHDDETLWGSVPIYGSQIGNDQNASWRKNTHMTLRDMIVKKSVEGGWVL